MKTKKSIIILRNTLIIFAVTTIYCVVKNFPMNTVLYSLFLCDFSIGICSRFLVGAILSIFKDSFTSEWMISFLRITTFAVFLGVSHYFAGTLTLADKKHKNVLTLLTGIFVLFPFSITNYAGDTFGFMDVFCMLIFLLTAYFCQNRILIYLTPLLMIVGVFMHESFLAAYMSPCLAIIAYYSLRQNNNRLTKAYPFYISSVAAVATAFYSVFFSRKTVTMTTEELLNYLANKGNTTASAIAGYVEDVVLWDYVRHIAPEDEGRNGFNYILYNFKIALSDFTAYYFVCIVASLPVIALIIIVWIKAIRSNTTFTGKIPYILFMLTLIPQIIGIMMSNDFTRFLSPIIIIQIFFLFITAREKDESTAAGLDLLNKNLQLFLLPCISVMLMNFI